MSRARHEVRERRAGEAGGVASSGELREAKKTRGTVRLGCSHCGRRGGEEGRGLDLRMQRGMGGRGPG